MTWCPISSMEHTECKKNACEWWVETDNTGRLVMQCAIPLIASMVSAME